MNFIYFMQSVGGKKFEILPPDSKLKKKPKGFFFVYANGEQCFLSNFFNVGWALQNSTANLFHCIVAVCVHSAVPLSAVNSCDKLPEDIF